MPGPAHSFSLRGPVISIMVCAALLAAAIGPASAAADHPAERVTGTLVTDHADALRGSTPRALPLFTLRTKGGRRRLRFQTPVSRNRLQASSSVALTGRVGRRSIAVRKLGRVRRTARARASTITGPRKTAVVLMRFGDTTSSISASTARSRVFTAPDSASAHFRDSSDGDISLVGKAGNADGDVYGPVEVAPVGTGCEYDPWSDTARAAAEAAGADLSGYHHVIYVLPQNNDCEWAGLGEMPGSWSMMNDTLDTWVVAHELGHNMNFHHAASQRCTAGGAYVALSSTCDAPSEYGDPFDAMGNNTDGRLFHAEHRRSAGWVTAAQSETVAQTGTYALNPLTTDAGTRVLRVPRGDGTTLDLEIRKPFGLFDDFAPSSTVVNGLTVRLAGPGAGQRTRLLDMTPPSSFTSSALPVGNTFTDPVSTTSVTLNALSPSAATVSVDLSGSGPDVQAPSVVSGVLAATVAPSAALVTWPAATDNIETVGYIVYRDGVEIGRPATAAFVDPGVAPGTQPSYTVRARDAAGNVSAPSGAALLDGPPSGSTPPPGGAGGGQPEPAAGPDPGAGTAGTGAGASGSGPSAGAGAGAGSTTSPRALGRATFLPRRVLALGGARGRGSASHMHRSDGRAYAVRASRSGTARLEAHFTRVTPRGRAMKLTLRGKASASCRGGVELYLPSLRRWTRLARISIARSARTMTFALGRAGTRYVSRGGVVRVRVSCGSRRLRTLSADLLRLTAG